MKMRAVRKMARRSPPKDCQCPEGWPEACCSPPCTDTTAHHDVPCPIFWWRWNKHSAQEELAFKSVALEQARKEQAG